MNGFLIVTHRVADYQRWKQTFDQSEELRRQYGLLGGWITRQPNQPQSLTVIIFCEDLAKAREFMNLPQFRQWLEQGTVQGQPEMLFLEEVQAVADVAHTGRG